MKLELIGEEEVIKALELLNDPDDLEALIGGTLEGLRAVAMRVTPVDTGSMQAAWYVTGRYMIINPDALNTRTSKPVMDYAEKVAARVGILDTCQGEFANVVEQQARKHGYV
jgi:hypothetical protein